MNLCDIKTVKDIMAMFGLNFQKKFGQNFLINNTVVEDIADSCCDSADSTVLEIGPGIGTLTRELAQRYRNIVALEIDRGFIPVLEYTLGEFGNTKVINEDVMKADLSAVLAPYFECGGVSVCANLPYYITTPILMKLLESGLPFDYITVMIQSEVADRLCAKAGSRDYGAITAVLAYYGQAEKLFRVEGHNFLPPPKVTSTVVRIKLYRDKPYKPVSEEYYFKTVKAAFEQRRKTLPNALSSYFTCIDKESLVGAVTDCGFAADIRGEKLGVGDFCRLSDRIYELAQRKADK